MIEEGIKVRIVAEDGSFRKSLGALQDQLKRFEADVENATNPESFNRLSRAVDATKQRTATLNSMRDPFAKMNRSSDQATQSLMNLSRIAQDAPYGFIGIANNINPMLESFQRLQASAGSTGLALRAMSAGLLGPAGIGLAVGVVSSLLVTFGDRLFRSKKNTDELSDSLKALKRSTESIRDDVSAKAFGDTAAEVTKVKVLAKAVEDTNRSYKERKAALEQLKAVNANYFGDLTMEAVKLGALTVKVKDYTRALVAAAAVKGFEDEIGKIAPLLAKEEKQLESMQKKLKQLKEPAKGLTSVDAGTAQTTVYDQRKEDIDNLTKSIITQAGVVDGLSRKYSELQDMMGLAVDKMSKFRPLTGGTKTSSGGTERSTFNFFDRFFTANPRTAKEKAQQAAEMYATAIDFASRNLHKYDGLLDIIAAPSQEGAIELAKQFWDKFQKGLVSENRVMPVNVRALPRFLPPRQEEVRTEIQAPIDSILQSMGGVKVSLGFTLELNKETAEIINQGKGIIGAFGGGLTKALNEVFEQAMSDAVKRGLAGKALSDFGEELSFKLAAAGAGAQTVATAFGDMINSFGTGQNAFEAFAQSMINSLKRLAAQLLQTAILAAALTAISGGTFNANFLKVLRFNKGGLVPGSGNSDTVPAMLTPGELVIPKHMVQQMKAGKLSIDAISKLMGTKMGGNMGAPSLPSAASARGLASPALATVDNSFPDFIPIIRDDQLGLLNTRTHDKQRRYT